MPPLTVGRRYLVNDPGPPVTPHVGLGTLVAAGQPGRSDLSRQPLANGHQIQVDHGWWRGRTILVADTSIQPLPGPGNPLPAAFADALAAADRFGPPFWEVDDRVHSLLSRVNHGEQRYPELLATLSFNHRYNLRHWALTFRFHLAQPRQEARTQLVDALRAAAGHTNAQVRRTAQAKQLQVKVSLPTTTHPEQQRHARVLLDALEGVLLPAPTPALTDILDSRLEE